MRDELDTKSVNDLIESACIERDQHNLSEIILTLQSRGTLEVFDAAYHLCVDQDPYKRIIGFRILEDLGTLELAFPNETRDLAIHLAEKESDTNVLIAIIRVLARVGGFSAVCTLEKLQQSPINQVRYGIISAVSHTLSKENQLSALPIVMRALIDIDIG
ncbi:MAG TPA: hypothetical protein VLH08_02265, partial [Acidobacteriota bacterium]|nr:hypothetical protein [Acidobacteriota bacterium]